MKSIAIYSLKAWLSFVVLASVFTHGYEMYADNDHSFLDIWQDLITFSVCSIPFCLYLFSIAWLLARVKKSPTFIKTILSITEMLLVISTYAIIILQLDYQHQGIWKITAWAGPRYLYPLLLAIPLSIWPYEIYNTDNQLKD
ncbi:hypothetical protein ACFQZS_17745 [Mucilaginibacter calamicampi]|uniref:Uncharacterized protein n=1 Tax=Mucilaginibacter calamicampi TaxID=1302352 RepID=A0ABW2YZT7_9SPHI